MQRYNLYLLVKVLAIPCLTKMYTASFITPKNNSLCMNMKLKCLSIMFEINLVTRNRRFAWFGIKLMKLYRRNKRNKHKIRKLRNTDKRSNEFI